jgi:hypothetical protein
MSRNGAFKLIFCKLELVTEAVNARRLTDRREEGHGAVVEKRGIGILQTEATRARAQRSVSLNFEQPERGTRWEKLVR